MGLKIKLSSLLLFLSFLFFSCEKELSLEGNVSGGSAVFTLSGAPAACTNAVVSGAYEAGVALGATNSIVIAVNVSTAGSYTISTAAVNGISFIGSGTFTSTGPQTIALTGSGIPTAAGTFSFTPGINGCTFSVTVGSGGGGTAVYTLSGAPGNCNGFTPGGTYLAGTALDATNIATIEVNVTTPGTYTISTNTADGIAFTGNGTFTATGTQAVQLSGTGTPVGGGTFDFTIGTNGCIFPLTVAGSSSGSGVFTYNGAPDFCTNAVFSGAYAAGSPLTSSNTVVIDVNVTTIGTYVITTNQVNGISFTGVGSFAATGAQTVVLTGAGTPLTEGDFNLTPSNNGCSFILTVDPAGSASTDFLKCTIDGVARTFNVDVQGESVDPTIFSFGGFETSAITSPYFTIVLNKSPVITTGTYNLISGTNTSTYNIPQYSDGTAQTIWTVGAVGQTGTFTVNVSVLTSNPNNIQGTFSGTIYGNNGLSTTDKKVVTNGQFNISYQ